MQTNSDFSSAWKELIGNTPMMFKIGQPSASTPSSIPDSESRIHMATLHDNALFLNQHPGPEGFTPLGILATVIVMTPNGLFGYWLYTRRSFWLEYLFLGAYSITSVSSPGHYLFPMVTPMSVKMHGLIWIDAVSGISLIACLLWSCAVVQEWRSTEIAD